MDISVSLKFTLDIEYKWWLTIPIDESHEPQEEHVTDLKKEANDTIGKAIAKGAEKGSLFFQIPQKGRQPIEYMGRWSAKTKKNY